MGDIGKKEGKNISKNCDRKKNVQISDSREINR